MRFLRLNTFIMIKQNTIINDLELTLLEFGKGDMGVTFGSEDEDRVFVAFANIEPREIASLKPCKEELNGFKVECLMSFNNPDSIDVVIRNLIMAKQLLTK